MTQFTNFRLDSGSLFPTEYELLELDFDTGDMNPDNYSPKVVDEASITNFSDETVTRTVTLHFLKEREEETNWEHSFGVMLDNTWKSGLIPSLVGNVKFELTLGYNYTSGGTSSTKKTIEFEETLEVPVSPNTITTVKMVVYEQENTVLPFTAKFRKTYTDDQTGQSQTVEVLEKGTWSGVLFYKTDIFIE